MPRVAKSKTKEKSVNKSNPNGAVTLSLKTKFTWFNKQVKRFGMTKKDFVLAASEYYVANNKPLLEG